MFRNILIASLLCSITPALAVTVEGGAGSADANSILIAKAEAACATDAVVSAALADICTSKKWPNIVKDGSRFYNRGAGAELNVLIRQAKPAASPVANN